MKLKFKRTVAVDFQTYDGMEDATYRAGEILEADKVEYVGTLLADVFLPKGIALGVPVDAYETLP